MLLISIYIDRYFRTNTAVLIKKLILHFAIFSVVMLASMDGAFETYGGTKTLLFSGCITLIVIGFFNACADFHTQKRFLVFDIRTVLPLHTYIISTVLIQIILCFVQATISLFILVVLFSIEELIQYFITCFLVLIAGDMLGLLCGYLVSSSLSSTMTIMASAIIIQFIFSGCLFTPTGIFKTLSTGVVSYHAMSAFGSIADLNQYISVVQDSMYIHSSAYIHRLWLTLILLSVIELIAGSLIFYTKLNYTHIYETEEE